MPKSYGRNERIAASLRREAAHILSTEIKDPRVRLATVTEVTVAPDLRNATIFVSFMDDDEAKIKSAMEALKKASGYVRSSMANRLKMRYMPNIFFEYDRLIRESMRIDALIAKGLGSKDSFEPVDTDEPMESDEAADSVETTEAVEAAKPAKAADPAEDKQG